MKNRTAIFRPLGLATVLAAGFAVVVTCIFTWGYSIVTSQSGSREYENVIVVSDGSAIIRSYNSETWQESYRTLDGKKLDKDFFKGKQQFNGTALEGLRNFELVQIPLASNARIQPVSDISFGEPSEMERQPLVFWYFIHDGRLDGRGYFEGFDSKAKRSVGYLGREGLSKTIPTEEQQFPMDGRLMGTSYAAYGIIPQFYKYREPDRNAIWYSGNLYRDNMRPTWDALLVSGDDLLAIDLKAGKSNSILKSPGMISLSILNDYYALDKEEHESSWPGLVAVRTVDRVIACDQTGKRVAEFPLAEELRRSTFTFYHFAKDKALITRQKRYLDIPTRQELIWIDTSGKILRREEVELVGWNYSPASSNAFLGLAICAESPLIMAIGGLVAGPEDVIVGMAGELSYADALRFCWARTWKPLAVLTILGAVLAYLCYRRQRRYAADRTWIWVVFVFLLGVPGYVGYRCHRRWAVLEGCPQCKAIVPRDREACAACGRAFPLPERKGIEVFA